jgi:hypothetical protein
MIPEVRRAIAFIVAQAASPQARYSAVYDYNVGGYSHFSGAVNRASVSIFDHAAGAHIQGSLQQFFHYGAGGQIQLVINGNQFQGFDYSSGNHFQGTVRRQNVQLYDFGSGGFFQYLVT